MNAKRNCPPNTKQLTNMPQADPAVQVEAVVRLERELAAARRRAASAIRQTREMKGVSLREAAKHIRLSPGALSQLERAASWQSSTAMRAARFLEKVA